MKAVKKEDPRTLKVLWITNIANPYRIPVWSALAKQINLGIALLAHAEPNRDWNFSEEQIGLPTTFLDARKLHKLLMQDLDAVILGGWESPAYLYALWIAKLRGLKTISHYGSTNKSHRHATGFLARFRSWFYRQLDSHVTYGTDATNSLLSMQIEAERIVTGFNSVDHEYFHNEVNLIRARNISQISKGHAFLYVGQLLQRKNIDKVIRAFSYMSDGADSLRIVGSGPEEQHLQNLIIELGLVNQIVMTGPKAGNALLEEYARANTLVLASTNEVWGLVVNEALASGLHVVVNKNCGVAADVKEMKGVYVCDDSLGSISSHLRDSADDWKGNLVQKPILQFNLKRSALMFVDAIKKVL
jgi:glycosyltransferase involved in cell wall biosynthesis